MKVFDQHNLADQVIHLRIDNPLSVSGYGQARITPIHGFVYVDAGSTSHALVMAPREVRKDCRSSCPI
jgi:hypothetical protein